MTWEGVATRLSQGHDLSRCLSILEALLTRKTMLPQQDLGLRLSTVDAPAECSQPREEEA